MRFLSVTIGDSELTKRRFATPLTGAPIAEPQRCRVQLSEAAPGRPSRRGEVRTADAAPRRRVPAAPRDWFGAGPSSSPGMKGAGKKGAKGAEGRGRRVRRFAWAQGLLPSSRDHHMWEWFHNLEPTPQRYPGEVLGNGSGSKKDYTDRDWMQAVGFLLAILLRHGSRAPWTRRPQTPVDGFRDLELDEWLWMRVSKAVQQPSLVWMIVSEVDVVEYVTALRNAEPRDIRVVLEYRDGVPWIQAAQGHAHELTGFFTPELILGEEFTQGREGYAEVLLHGIDLQNARSIQYDGILRGGVGAY